MLEYLEKNIRNIAEVDTAAAPIAQCSITRPSSGTAAKKNKKTFALKMSGKKCQSVATKSIIAMLRKKPDDVVDERRSGHSQSTMESSTKTPEERQYVCM